MKENGLTGSWLERVGWSTQMVMYIKVSLLKDATLAGVIWVLMEKNMRVIGGTSCVMDLGAKSGKMELNMKENMYQAVKKDMAELFS